MFLIGITGFCVAIIGSMIGIGGGIFMVPLLTLVFHIPMKVAITAVLFAMVPYSLMGTLINSKNKLIFFKLGILLEIPTIFGVILGSWLCSYLPAELLQQIFGIIVTISGVFIIQKTNKKTKKESWLGNFLKTLNSKMVICKIPRENQTLEVGLLMVLAFGLVAGTMAGLLGIGGGWLKTPLMIFIFGLAPKEAVATSIFMITMTSTTGASSHFFMGQIYLSLTITLMIAFPLGAILGSLFLPKLKGEILQKMIGGGVSMAGLVMFFSSWI